MVASLKGHQSMEIQLGCCLENLRPLYWELEGSCVCILSRKICVVRGCCLLYSMLECIVDVGKFNLWVSFKSFETLVLELQGSRVVENIISFLFKF